MRLEIDGAADIGVAQLVGRGELRVLERGLGDGELIVGLGERLLVELGRLGNGVGGSCWPGGGPSRTFFSAFFASAYVVLMNAVRLFTSTRRTPS
jgi:hypothetical protein